MLAPQSKWDDRILDYPVLPGMCPRDGGFCITPAFTDIAATAGAKKIQQSFALCIEVEKLQYQEALPEGNRMLATDQFVIIHTAVCETYGAKYLNSHPGTSLQAWSKYNGIQVISLKTYVLFYGTVVERAGKGRDKVQLFAGSPLQKAAAGNLYDDFQLWRLMGRLLPFLYKHSGNIHP